jgi:SnoaL-like protein
VLQSYFFFSTIWLTITINQLKTIFMKKLILLGLAVITMIACKQEQRYFAESAEIDSIKAAITAYESGNMDVWKSYYADTAKIYNNSNKAISVDENLKGVGEMIINFSSYGFNHEEEHIEMVKDKEDETWVYYWATWNGSLKANDKELSIPVHLAIRFIDGKAVAEHGYWDTAPINAAFAAVAAKMEEESMEADSKGGGE